MKYFFGSALLALVVFSGCGDKKEEQKNIEDEIMDKKKKFTIPKNKRYKILANDIQNVLSLSTGIPVSDLSQSDIDNLKNLPKTLNEKII